MSCKPANITSDITDSCDLKCKLFTDYPSQGITVTGITEYEYIKSFTIPDIHNMSIEYNFKKLPVIQIRINSPSIQLYNGKRADAELCIIHRASQDDTPLLMIIPIKVGYSSSELDDVINKISNNSSTEFDLNKFIPSNRFYTYTGTIQNSVAMSCNR